MAENKNENQSYSSLINMKKNPLECLNHIHGFLKNGARGTWVHFAEHFKKASGRFKCSVIAHLNFTVMEENITFIANLTVIVPILHRESCNTYDSIKDQLSTVSYLR